MHYLSTRGRAPIADFETALLSGIAPDGGLYLPSAWPLIGEPVLAALRDAPFDETAAAILEPFVSPWLDADELRGMTKRAFCGFANDDVAPLVRIGEADWLLELFHGPTLAFKDIAMQLLGVFFEHALQESNGRAAIIGATSGDTGGAAIEAFRGKDRVEVFILHPAGRVSEVQRRMMTAPPEANIHNIAVHGTFDDCQRIVKALLNDRDFCEETQASVVNSINWARLAIQTVYYFTALMALERETGAKSASFSVPTGNFGDVFAGYAAKRMGAGVDTLCVAVNQNDILHRVLTKGRYEPVNAEPTTSPSMDIQVASNFERALFEAGGRDASGVRALMEALERDGAYDLPDAMLNALRETFMSERVSEAENEKAIASLHADKNMLIDPHTAVAIAAARKARRDGRLKGHVISLATAHPAKFPDAVKAASGVSPALPERFGDLFDLPERMVEAAPETAAIRALILGGGRERSEA